MKSEKIYLDQPKNFWAYIRSISEEMGYTVRGKNLVKIITSQEMQQALTKRGLNITEVLSPDLVLTKFGNTIIEYFKYRADVLNNYVEPRLMDVDRAKLLFYDLKENLKPTCPLPMNKQKGDKKAPNYFTGIINMLIEANTQGYECNYDPRSLTTITRDDLPLRTLARWVDGAFPGVINPVAIWEIKEYYYTTTFGSRIADGVYETLLDGMELYDLKNYESIDIKHYMMVDSHNTWWNMGKSYLCRMVDMINMGFVDEVLFGIEVVERIPELTKEWISLYGKRHS